MRITPAILVALAPASRSLDRLPKQGRLEVFPGTRGSNPVH